MTRSCPAALALVALCSASTAAAQTTSVETAPTPAATATQTGDDGDRSYPNGSLGFKLELLSLPLGGYGSTGNGGIAAFSYPVLLEGALDIHPRFTFFVGFGTYLQYQQAENDDFQQSERVGVILLQGGFRLNLMEPRPGHAHLFLVADLAGAIGVAVYDSDGERDEDAEDEAKEYLDHLMWGVGVGVEYLVVAEFGVGAEFGFRWSYNNLEDTEEELDGLYSGQFTTYFGLKLAYHF
jgi:hypothetical protein